MECTTLVTDVTSTRVGFGCAGLMREPSASRRQRLLNEAFDEGITHFDVARMYGLGAAEREVGRFAKGRRDRVVIATKFGIAPASAPRQLARLQGPARWLLSRQPALRTYVKRRSELLHQPHRYDVATARASLQASLRELRTDYVDLLLLHDPSPTDRVNLPELCGYLEDARRTGYLRAWGIAGEHNPCVGIKQSLPAEAILQLRDDILSRTPGLSDGLAPLVTFGVLSTALARILAYLTSHPERRPQWYDSIGIDCASSDALASLLLRDALRANGSGVVLYSTTRLDRLRGLSAAISSERGGDDPALIEFRRRVLDELVPTSRPDH
jgi:D-threo-aldose 1-dehydrogenase